MESYIYLEKATCAVSFLNAYFIFQKSILQIKLFRNVTGHFIFPLCIVMDVKDGECSPISTLRLFLRTLRNTLQKCLHIIQTIVPFSAAANKRVTISQSLTLWLMQRILCFIFVRRDRKRRVCLLQTYLHYVKACSKTSPVPVELIYLCSTVALYEDD